MNITRNTVENIAIAVIFIALIISYVNAYL